MRVLVFGAQAPTVLGKLRSSVLARRHAPATPVSTRGRAPARRRFAARAHKLLKKMRHAIDSQASGYFPVLLASKSLSSCLRQRT